MNMARAILPPSSDDCTAVASATREVEYISKKKKYNSSSKTWQNMNLFIEFYGS